MDYHLPGEVFDWVKSAKANGVQTVSIMDMSPKPGDPAFKYVSGSEMTRKQYDALRILRVEFPASEFKRVFKNDMLLSKAAYAQVYLKLTQWEEFKKYQASMTSDQTPLGNIGAFTTVRYQQRLIESIGKDDNKRSNPKRKATSNVSYTAQIAEEEPPAKRAKDLFPAAEVNPADFRAPHDKMPVPADDEQDVNACFHSLLCVFGACYCKTVTCTMLRKTFELGNPTKLFSCAVDGVVVKHPRTELEEVAAIVEVKPHARMGARKYHVEMQEGAEMACWIASAPPKPSEAVGGYVQLHDTSLRPSSNFPSTTISEYG
jgi:hypothetical protein